MKVMVETSAHHVHVSDADLETLRKIRLLRSLHIPLDYIRALIRGVRRLYAVLGTHIT